MLVAVIVGVAAAFFVAAKGVLRIPIRLQQKAAEREQKRKQEIAAANTHKHQQQQYQQALTATCTESFGLFESMPIKLVNAEDILDEAERYFNEGAFAPFWDSVEHAARQLGEFDNSVRTITANAKTHADLVPRLESPAPPFPIILDSVTGMAAANTTADRLQSVVRAAQRNFQFATIFEQRKTNQLLVAGFTNLAQALDGMGRRIESSIENLSGQISRTSSTLDQSLHDLGSNLSDTLSELNERSLESSAVVTRSVDALHASVQKDSVASAQRHKEALEMLDNIQRRRKPFPPKIGDGQY